MNPNDIKRDTDALSENQTILLISSNLIVLTTTYVIYSTVEK